MTLTDAPTTTVSTDAVAAPAAPSAPQIPDVEPYQVAPDTWLIPTLNPAEPGTYVMSNSLVIVGAEPIIVDTGAPLHRDAWLEMVGSVVDLDDVRWIFLSHDDGDHIGNMHAALEAAPKARIVTNFFSNERAAFEPDRAMPLDRQVWLQAGESFDAGDRRLHLFRPPIFDGPTTRGLYDETTGVMWAVDSFAALTTGAVFEVGDLPAPLYDETFTLFNSMVSPWHEWLSQEIYGRHVDSIEAIGASVVTSSHGPVLRGSFIPGAYDRVRALAGRPAVAGPGQETLDALLAPITQVG